MLWWLLACRPQGDICLGSRSSPFVPVEEEEVRAAEADLVWEATEGSSLATVESCPQPPCVELQGPGEMSAFVELNREVDSRVRAWLWAEGPSRLELRKENSAGEFETIAGWDIPEGDSELDRSFSIDQPGGRTTLVAVTEGRLRLDEPTLSSSTWAAVDDRGTEQLRLGFLIHAERQNSFVKEEASFQRRAVILEDLAELLHGVGQRLTVQVDDSFLEGATRWDPGWFKRMRAMGAGWSVHLHAGGSEENFTEVLDASLAAFDHLVRSAPIAIPAPAAAPALAPFP
jgi:hypothetical protein